jgi:hypothetical protein
MMPFRQEDRTKTLGDESPRPPLFFNNFIKGPGAKPPLAETMSKSCNRDQWLLSAG